MELSQNVPTAMGFRYRNLTICSRDLVNGAYLLPSPIMCRGVALNSVTLCNSWQMVDSTNDTLLVVVRYYPSGWVYSGQMWKKTITLPHGNYNILTLASQMQTQLNRTADWEAAEGTTTTFPGASFTVNVDSISSKINISTSDAHYRLVVQGFDDPDFPSSAGRLLGFNKKVSILSNTDPSNSFTGDSLPSLNRITVFNVVSRELGNRLYDNIHSSFPLNSSIIFSAPVTGSFGQCFDYTNSQGNHVSYFDDRGQSSTQVASIDLDITDENHVSINFQGQAYWVHFSFLV
jgi:hypothetical protein